MLERILSIDTQLFLLINKLPHPSFLVFIGRLLSGAETLGLTWFLIVLVLIIKEHHHKTLFLELVVALIGAGFTAQYVVKNIVGRLRPELVLNNITVYAKVNDYFSFPSGHATTAFAGAVIVSRIFPKGAPYFYFLAFLIAFSRIYLGVHYPLDVLTGIILGLVIGFMVIKLTKPSKKIKAAISILILFSFLTFPQKAHAKTVLYVEQNNLSIYNDGSFDFAQDKQVLGLSTLNLSQKILKIDKDQNGLSVGITQENGEVLGNQALDEIIVKNEAGNFLKVVGDRGKLLLQEKLVQVATNLPILIKQSTGQLLASTSVGDKLISYTPEAVIKKLQQEKILPRGEIPVKLELKEEGARLVYQITETKNKKLFGFIPVTANVTTTVSAETGKIDNQISPWFYQLLQRLAV